MYLAIKEEEESMVLKGVLNSWEAMVTNRDFNSFNSFSFTNAFLNQDNEITFGQQNANRLGDYHKLDLSAFYDFHLDAENSVRGRLGVSVINIYNHDNEIDRAFREDENAAGNAELQELSNVGLGITPNLVFRVYF